jgi:hypothetical protein
VSRPLEELPFALQWAVRTGLMTLAFAQDADALADSITDRVARGELTVSEGVRLAEEQGERDGKAMLAARARKGQQP